MGDFGSFVFMYEGRFLKCIGMVIGNILYGGCIVILIEVIFEVFQNYYYFDDLFFYFFDNKRDDDDDFDYGGSDDNDGDDENDGFDYY